MMSALFYSALYFPLVGLKMKEILYYSEIRPYTPQGAHSYAICSATPAARAALLLGCGAEHCHQWHISCS
jgi:hypothetical protein